MPALSWMPLQCHGDSPPPAGLSVAAGVARDADGMLRFHYVLRGRLADLRLPLPAPGERTDGLWRNTCLEAFIRDAQGGAYVELNFAPSGQWAFYAFDGYRAGMRNAAADPAPVVQAHAADDVLEVSAHLPLAQLRAALPARPWRLALCAVIESMDGAHSYWALAHAQGKPDFHHDAGFTLTLEGTTP